MLEVKNFTKKYNNGKLAVDDISFEVKNGEIFGFLGPNGAGENSIIVTDTIIKLNQGLKASTKFLNKMILIWICHLFVEFTK